ncbi:MAG: flagellar hook-length control protein FliK [Lachnospiraceae bacterium]|nr:flagellar hook-length control protein FliK [Lachnospiraceae bacterium]
MNLGSVFKRDNPNIRSNDTVKVPESMSRGERAYRIQNEIRNMAPGQTIQGSVISRDGNSVQIALRQNMLINARIDQNISLALGQNMSFEVKANNGSVLSLTPLYANMANEATIMRALNAAGLPETANNIEMVAVMMEEGMPIDKESLANISRFMMEFPNRNPATLIQMARLGLPITEINIEQFEQYQNANHQLLGSAETIMDELPQIFHELMGEGKIDQAFAFYESILDIFTDEEAEGTIIQKGEAQAESADGTVVTENAASNEQAAQTTEQAVTQTTEQAAAEAKGAANDVVLDMVKPDETGNASQSSGQVSQQSAVLTDSQWNTLGNLLRELGVDENTAEQIRNGQLPPKEVLTLIREFMPKHGADELHTRVMERLFEGKAFENLLKEEVGRQWLIEPKDVADPHKIEQLYERVREQSMRLNEAMQAADKADAPVARSVQNLQQNVDFMNQLNHMFTYIQLPLKLAGNNAHGDLYVYTNKKNLAAKDGNVSALLHLDMEHLGALDVYVTMQQNKVNTNFTLQDESSLDLIAQHISLLDERLAKRGYNLKANFSVKEDQEEQDSGIMQTILNQGKNISLLSRTSFDMRA